MGRIESRRAPLSATQRAVRFSRRVFSSCLVGARRGRGLRVAKRLGSFW